VYFFPSCDKAVPKKSPLPKPAATQARPQANKRAKESSSSEDSSDSSDDEKPPAKQKPRSGKYQIPLLLCGRMLSASAAVPGEAVQQLFSGVLLGLSLQFSSSLMRDGEWERL